MTENTITAVQQGITIIVVDPAYTFNEYVSWRRHNAYQGETVIPINYDRMAFLDYIGGMSGHSFTLDVWHRYYEQFIRSQAARGLHDTQADALV